MKASRPDSRGQNFTLAADEPGETWAVDVKHLSQDPVTGHRYLLIAVDMMSRYAYMRPLKTASGAEVLENIRTLVNMEPKLKRI